jgi:hypothetical protein
MVIGQGLRLNGTEDVVPHSHHDYDPLPYVPVFATVCTSHLVNETPIREKSRSWLRNDVVRTRNLGLLIQNLRAKVFAPRSLSPNPQDRFHIANTSDDLTAIILLPGVGSIVLDD